MAFVINFFKGVRNHWKKSTVAVIALGYGANYAVETYQTDLLMRDYCKIAKKYGEEPISNTEHPRKITVILNPNANKRKATKLFENYCAPILNLAGICVDVVQTQSEGHARNLVQDLNTDAIVVAGGDGTISEVMTGLLRSRKEHIPVGILPVGRTNTVCNKLFPGGDHLPTVTMLADAAMAVVTQHYIETNVMQIEQVADNETEPTKPIYALVGLQWGAYRDAQARKDKYWVFGSFRNYMTYIFNGYKSSLSWNCNANISYTPPCPGCKNCYNDVLRPQIKKQEINRWWSAFVPKKETAQQINVEFATRENENCKQVQNKQISTCDMSLLVSDLQDEPANLKLVLGPKDISYTDFVNNGFQYENIKQRTTKEVIPLRSIEIIPETKEESWYSIDQEEYEAKPVKITILPKAVKVYCKHIE